MREVEAKSVTFEVKDSTGVQAADEWCLVHDGKQIVAFAPPKTRTSTPSGHTMLVGTKEELEAEVKRLDLQPRRRLQVSEEKASGRDEGPHAL